MTWPNSGFEADYDEIEIQKYSYGVISVTSSPLRHKNFSYLGPSQSKFLATPVSLYACFNVYRFVAVFLWFTVIFLLLSLPNKNFHSILFAYPFQSFAIVRICFEAEI